MKWLIWREYRLNRLVLIAGLVLLLLPYVIGLTIFCWDWAFFSVGGPDAVISFFAGAAIYSVVLCQLTPALLGGNAIAGERADRSAEFIAYLPLSRPRRLANKLILTLVTMVLLWAVNLAVLLSCRTMLDEAVPTADRVVLSFLHYSAITGFTFFGVAWLVSSLQSSPTFAVCGGLATPLVIFMGMQGAAWARDAPFAPDFYRFVGIGYAITCSLVTVVCFSIGTWYYLRRVEP